MRILFALCTLLLTASAARADWITEFGGGYKLPSTSVVLLPECDFVNLPSDSGLYAARGGRPTASCGGDNPVAVIWPIAWEAELNEAFTWRLGWFHLSHYGDGSGRLAEMLGGDGRETHLDCLCGSIRVNWSARRRLRH